MNLKIKKIKKDSKPSTTPKPVVKKKVKKHTGVSHTPKLTKQKNVNPKVQGEDRYYKEVDTSEMKMNDILIYFYEKYEGDWDLIYKAINQKERVNYGEASQFLKSYKDKYDYVTLIDNDYPEEYKGNYKPPFVLRKRKKN